MESCTSLRCGFGVGGVAGLQLCSFTTHFLTLTLLSLSSQLAPCFVFQVILRRFCKEIKLDQEICFEKVCGDDNLLFDLA